MNKKRPQRLTVGSRLRRYLLQFCGNVLLVISTRHNDDIFFLSSSSKIGSSAKRKMVREEAERPPPVQPTHRTERGRAAFQS